MRSSLVVLAALALVACKKPEAPTPAQPAPSAQQAPAAAPVAANTVKGKVLEKLDAAPYSYLKLATPTGETWAAVPQAPTKAGEEVTISVSAPMTNFESKTLNRKFDLVLFGTLAGGEGAAPAPMQAAPGPQGGEPPPSPAAMAAQHQAAAAGPTDVKIAKITKAAGPDGKTVEELFTGKAGLKDKPVTVKGQVVKFSPGIMGRNWIHLRDGSGKAEKNNHDVTITTQDDAKVGDVVTVKGTVKVDKDFGAGYAYPVIIEDAKVSK
ncbi:MAG: nucleotide-binding protein [Deltaproteobacteria bacterium]|nr:nucleotide-binding protein [Deltaproteobacteria bacterium]